MVCSFRERGRNMDNLSSLRKQRKRLIDKQINMEKRLSLQKRRLKKTLTIPRDKMEREIQKMSSQMANHFKDAQILYGKAGARDHSQRAQDLKQRVKHDQEILASINHKINSLENNIAKTEKKLALTIQEIEALDRACHRLQFSQNSLPDSLSFSTNSD